MTPITAETLRESGWVNNGVYATKGGCVGVLRFKEKHPIVHNWIDGCRWSSFGVVHTMEELAIVEEIVNRLYRQ